MQIKQIRLANLQRLVQEFGTIAAVATLSHTSENYLVQILNGHKLPSGKTRGIGNALAEKLEKGCGKEPGFMDTNHEPTVPSEEPRLTAKERELLTLFRRADVPTQLAILVVARLAK